MDRRIFQKELLKSDFNRVVCIASIEDDLEILNTISAFSNTSGGTLFLGVNSKCKVIGRKFNFDSGGVEFYNFQAK